MKCTETHAATATVSAALIRPGGCVSVCVCKCVCVSERLRPLSWDWVSFRSPIDPFQSEPSHQNKKKGKSLTVVYPQWRNSTNVSGKQNVWCKGEREQKQKQKKEKSEGGNDCSSKSFKETKTSRRMTVSFWSCFFGEEETIPLWSSIINLHSFARLNQWICSRRSVCPDLHVECGYWKRTWSHVAISCAITRLKDQKKAQNRKFYILEHSRPAAGHKSAPDLS